MYEIWSEIAPRYVRKLDVDLFSRMLCWTADSESKIFKEDLRSYTLYNPDVSKFVSLHQKFVSFSRIFMSLVIDLRSLVIKLYH